MLNNSLLRSAAEKSVVSRSVIKFYGDSVVRRTILGYNETRSKRVLGTPELRHLLFLIDRPRRVFDLQNAMAPIDALPLIVELAELELIECVSAEGAVAKAVNSSASTQLSTTQFEAARRASLQATYELLGGDERELAKQIIDCRNSMELRQILNLVEQKVDLARGASAVQFLFETIRRAVSDCA